MALLVVKFGGTSLGDVNRIINAAKIIKNLINNNNKVITVVSAMAGTTNRILSLCNDISKGDNNGKLEEYDAALTTGESLSASLFALALLEQGINSQSMQAWQVPIHTSSSPNTAMIEDINTNEINSLITRNIVPVITGFQGLTKNSRLSTIGRGGSDTTAAAIAASVKADFCDIYTDVEGLYTCDPRLIHNAKIVKELSYEQTLELTGSGAKVLHPRSVEICMRYNIPIRIFSTFTNISGTTIMNRVNETKKVTAISYMKKLSLVQITNLWLPIAEFFELLSENGVNIHQIIRIEDNSIIFCLQNEYLSKFNTTTLDRSNDIQISENIANTTIVGASIGHKLFILSKIIRILNSHNVKLIELTNSEIKVSLYIDEERVDFITKKLHEELIENA